MDSHDPSGFSRKGYQIQIGLAKLSMPLLLETEFVHIIGKVFGCLISLTILPGSPVRLWWSQNGVLAHDQRLTNEGCR